MKTKLPKPQDIYIPNILTDRGTQTRKGLNEEHVKDIMRGMEALDPRDPDPVVLFKNEAGEYIMADGFHRLAAHERLNRSTIKAHVLKGGIREARHHATGANTFHGLKLSREENDNAVRMELTDDPTQTDRKIAGHCGVSHTTVANVRRRMTEAGQLAKLPVETRTGADGKTRKVPRPKSKVPVKPVESEPDTSFNYGANAPDGDQAAPAPQARTDAVGVEIPDHLQEQWDTATAETMHHVKAVQELRRAVQADAEAQHKVFIGAPNQEIMAHVQTLLSELKASIPHAICPYCRADATMKNCRFCEGRGMVGRFKYEKQADDLVKPK